MDEFNHTECAMMTEEFLEEMERALIERTTADLGEVPPPPPQVDEFASDFLLPAPV
jgi:hypothetical protein